MADGTNYAAAHAKLRADLQTTLARMPRDTFGEGTFSRWEQGWRDLTGETARGGLRHLALRISRLEIGERVSIETLQRLATEAAAERAKPFEALHAALKSSHEEALARIQSLDSHVEDLRAVHHALHAALEDVRDAVQEHVERLERTIAALPEALRADLRIELDNLRNTPDAVTALLYGAETFAGAVARSLDDAE